MRSTHLKAVIFDVGGVVVKSPLEAIAAYEREHGLPPDYINCSIGAWQQFERGEIPLLVFYEAFGRELSDATHANAAYEAFCARKRLSCPTLPQGISVDGRELFGRMMRHSQDWDHVIVHAIRRLRAVGQHRVIALTNNYSATQDVEPAELEYLGWKEGATPPALRALFDDFCDSSTLGMRKPEPEFYLLACKRSGVLPTEAVFLDDLRLNLKAAKALGMETIHVPIGGSLHAVQQLEEKLGMELTAADRTSKL